MADRLTIRELPDHVGSSATVRGWVMKSRSSGKIAFTVLRDGTGYLKCVIPKAEVSAEVWGAFERLTQEMSVSVTGEVREDARSPGGVELGVTGVELLGKSTEFPVTPKEHGTSFLFEHRHLWLRSRKQVAIMRVRNEVIQAIREYLYNDRFVLVDTPILTGSIGESAGTLFETEYFEFGKAFLAQTGQLYLEAAAAALGKVYSFGPTFRAEKSKTKRHLAEFWMMEPEMAWYDSNDNMRLQESLIAYVVERCLERCGPALTELERDVTLLQGITPPFDRISYDDAIKMLQDQRKETKWGVDLGADEETALASGRDKPVFVFNYPKKVRAFYMKENPENTDLVLNNDLLAPEGYGEIIGGSQREDDLDRLLARIREEELPEEAYGWYLDLRRYGTFVHSGFGLGIERTVAWICGIPHIREAIAFPRMMTKLYP